MKHFATIFLLLDLLASSPAYGQSTLLIAQTYAFVDGAGVPYYGDSTTLDYNSQLLVNQKKTWNIDSTGSWYLDHRATDITYDANGNLLYSLSQTGNDISGWTNSHRFIFTYDNNDKLLSGLRENWNGTAWVMHSLTTYVYDANGNMLSYTQGSIRILYTYDAQNLLLMSISQQLDAGNWIDNTRVDYAYSPNSKTETTYTWENLTWKEYSRTTETFDGSGNMIQYLFEQWDGTAWANIYQTSHNYDANGNVLQDLAQDWNGATWVNSSLTDYTYDAENNLTYWIASNWINNTWQGSYRQFGVFNQENNYMSERSELWDGASWSLVSYRNNYYAVLLSTHTLAVADFKIFPNPANSAVTIQGEGLTQAMVFDQQGRPVRSQSLQGQGEETLQLGNLPAGNYILQVLGNDGKMGAKPLQIRR
ncbi:MAG: T9SS type A sorting domain-containing protein [Saprospiraceae bacterium]|nr:T9SS type A sorting domain-containing protein [Saprospiraceae bacterium]